MVCDVHHVANKSIMLCITGSLPCTPVCLAHIIECTAMSEMCVFVTGSYTQWISETGIINLLTPTGQKDAALQSVFQKAQISDEAQQAADDMSRMEMENTALHNMECAALVRTKCVCMMPVVCCPST